MLKLKIAAVLLICASAKAHAWNYDEQEKINALNRIANAQEQANVDNEWGNIPVCNSNPLESGKCLIVKRSDYPDLPIIKDDEGNVEENLFICPTKYRVQ